MCKLQITGQDLLRGRKRSEIVPDAEIGSRFSTLQEIELFFCRAILILRAILENEVTRRAGPPHRPNPTAGCVRWGKQSGYVVFGGQKIPLERPRVRTPEGQEVELQSYGELQQDGKLQRAVRERMVAGLPTRNYRRAVESVVEGYGIEMRNVFSVNKWKCNVARFTSYGM